MSEIEHTRTLGKAHQYVNTKILLLAGIINRSSKNAGDVLLRRSIDDATLISKPPT
jgi:hypothetical protein